MVREIRCFLFLILLTLCLPLHATLIVTGDYSLLRNGSDSIYLVPTLSSASFQFEARDTHTLEWQSYTTSAADASLILSEAGQTALSLPADALSDMTAYRVLSDGNPISSFWLIDLSAHPFTPTITQMIDMTSSRDNSCRETYVEGSYTALTTPLSYRDAVGTSHTLSSDYTLYLSYTTLRPDATTYELTETTVDDVWIGALPASGEGFFSLSLENIYTETPFRLLLKDSDGNTISASEPYSVSSLHILPLVSVTGRLFIRGDKETNTNEHERGDTLERRALSGSAPLDVRLQTYQNDVVTDLTWRIYRVGERDTLVRRGDLTLNEEDFSRAAEYIVRVEGRSADGCQSRDSISISIGDNSDEVFIEVPNVFTPNGDGKNDEFRVAYRSILKYEIWVYNRWGRLVYHAKDPAKGWDGRIGGTPAAVGAYYYVIQATGTDGKHYNRSGDINLLRGNSR